MRRLLAAAAIAASFVSHPAATDTALAALVVGLTIHLIRNARRAA